MTVYIPGCWDLLHVGHLAVLERARALGDSLTVGVAADEVIREDKGRPPVIPLGQRLRLLRSLRCVDAAEPYYRLEFLTHLEAFAPDILAVGATWGTEQRHRDAEEWVRWHGGRLVILPYTENVSTTEIKRRILHG